MDIKQTETPIKHRDLTWLKFNERVLQEAADITNPLYERIKFLAIFSSNLDEYFRVRISNLRQIKKVDKSIRKRLKFRPNKILKKIYTIVDAQQEKFGQIFRNEIIPELKENGIEIISQENLTTEHTLFIEDFYNHQLKNTITTVQVENTEKPFLENNKIYFAVFINEEISCFVSVPTDKISRFIKLPSSSGSYHYIFLDDIIKYKISDLLSIGEKIEAFPIKISRDAELYFEDTLDVETAELIKNSLNQRNTGQPTRLLFDKSMKKSYRRRLRQLLGLGKIDMFKGGKYHNFSDFMDFPDPLNNKNLHFKSMPPLNHPQLNEAENYFDLITEKDRIIHYPYYSFQALLDFVKQAVNDKQVKAIKITFYRIAHDSALSKLLLQAIDTGKKVVIFVEAKARFDEMNNLQWGEKFEEKGATVIYSSPNIKVHSKIMLVQREEDNKLVNYGYISTGNFNSKTAKVYVDHAIFTVNQKITGELAQIFDLLEKKIIMPKSKHLFISPYTTRREFSLLIENEIENAKKGVFAAITAKMNSLEDEHIIKKLYEASQAGVKINLIVRGICNLVPGVKGLSDNIKIISIVDRFLEHGRIYLFENGGDKKMYIGSADWMQRNLDRRIEVLIPIYDTDVFEELNHILELQLKDNVKARIIDADESNHYISADNSQNETRSQYEIYKYLKTKK
ncbi:polyphosphate kinase 1 [Abyssalbus ytuae]|uniref:Polyphosphate kinase n=1 Tax=Abyssalbus ytuae TaxID=2926907 RepID=A0A9E7A0I5_9FLAO|nr:polyphosphate kinase 1 [Abyssalbus ytuae]UOB17451.1 polyphosphate kinase 1 [Abyssalbus ytuae]